MINHLIIHERITTTITKAKALSIYADKVISIARKAH
jgi:ribosomal protein L17